MIFTRRRKFLLYIRRYFSTEIWQQELTNDLKKRINEHWSKSIAFEDNSTKDDVEKKLYIFPALSASNCSSLDQFRLLTVSECIARYYQLKGKNVYHPIALCDVKFRDRLAKFRYDFHRIIETNELNHAKWTQCLFLKLFNTGLTYKAEIDVSLDLEMSLVDSKFNADDQSSISGTEVFEKIVQQWFIRTSVYTNYLPTQPTPKPTDPFLNHHNEKNIKVKDLMISQEGHRGILIPIIHCPECGTQTVPEDQLPVMLPLSSDFKMNESLDEWINTICPKCGSNAFRENSSLDSVFSSSWNYLRYLDANNESEPFSSITVNRFLPVDLYVVSEEDAMKISILAQFWCNYFHSNGLLFHRKPFSEIISIGSVKGLAYRTKEGKYANSEEIFLKDGKAKLKKTQEPLIVSWEKMNKMKHNHIEPEKIINVYGIDTTRLFMISKVPPQSQLEWDVESFTDELNWQTRLWSLMQDFLKIRQESAENMLWIMMDKENMILRDTRNRYIREITLHYHNYELSAVIDTLRKLTNILTGVSRGVRIHSSEYEKAFAALIVMMTPVMPRLASTLWLGFKQAEGRINKECEIINWQENVSRQKWPELDIDATIPMHCQINDKINFFAFIPNREVLNLTEETAIKICRKVFRVKKYLKKEDIIKVQLKSFENLSAECRIETRATIKANLSNEKTSV